MLVVIISTTSHNFFFFSSRRRHTRCLSDLSSDVCSSDLADRPRPHSILTYSPRARPTSSRLVFQSSRWLRHQHTEEPGFLGPSMVATSLNRAVVAGWTTMLTVPGYDGRRVPVSPLSAAAPGTAARASAP